LHPSGVLGRFPQLAHPRCMSDWPPGPILFLPQGNHRIDARGAARGNNTCQCCYRHKNHGDGNDSRDVVGPKSVEQSTHQARCDRRQDDTDGESGERHTHCAPQKLHPAEKPTRFWRRPTRTSSAASCRARMTVSASTRPQRFTSSLVQLDDELKCTCANGTGIEGLPVEQAHGSFTCLSGAARPFAALEGFLRSFV
jgi:hypothetical protein